MEFFVSFPSSHGNGRVWCSLELSPDFPGRHLSSVLTLWHEQAVGLGNLLAGAGCEMPGHPRAPLATDLSTTPQPLQQNTSWPPRPRSSPWPGTTPTGSRRRSTSRRLLQLRAHGPTSCARRPSGALLSFFPWLRYSPVQMVEGLELSGRVCHPRNLNRLGHLRVDDACYFVHGDFVYGMVPGGIAQLRAVEFCTRHHPRQTCSRTRSNGTTT